MDIRFVPPEIDAIDALRCEAIVATYFDDEKPLQGALGLIDWRMCGVLSRAVVRGDLTGAAGEAAMVPLRPRMGIDKLFLLGLGPTSAFDERTAPEVTMRMLEIVSRAKVRTTALVLPGRSTARVTPAAAMESFFTASHAHPGQDEVILLEPADAQREMEPIVQRERRRARAAGA